MRVSPRLMAATAAPDVRWGCRSPARPMVRSMTSVRRPSAAARFAAARFGETRIRSTWAAVRMVGARS
ncbi:hypothetical protein HBB16_20420 [Pseudonocardia sp. MCCB 268]|nr:hypothetical protein [Pseudonocardia cytotoxica]